ILSSQKKPVPSGPRCEVTLFIFRTRSSFLKLNPFMEHIYFFTLILFFFILTFQKSLIIALIVPIMFFILKAELRLDVLGFIFTGTSMYVAPDFKRLIMISAEKAKL